MFPKNNHVLLCLIVTHSITKLQTNHGNTMQTQSTKPAQAYYKLVGNTWQRCALIGAQLVVRVVAPMNPVSNEFIHAVDWRSNTAIDDLDDMPPEICTDINLRK